MKVLICSDGLSQSNDTIRFGALLAIMCATEVTLLGITDNPEEKDTLCTVLKHSQQLLTARNLHVELSIKVGEPSTELLKHTEATAYDLVIIGAMSEGTHNPFLLATNVCKMIKKVKPPVLVVIGDRPTLQRILICSGGKKYSDKAVELAGKIAQRASATVTLFHVVAEPPVLLTNLIQKEEDVDLLFRSNTELGRNLRREQEALEQMGVPCTVLLRHGFVIREVCKEVQHGDYDLVVTGLSLNRGALRTYLMGNLTNEIINCAERPVLVVRSAEEPLGIGHDLKELFSEITDVLHHTKEQTR